MHSSAPPRRRCPAALGWTARVVRLLALTVVVGCADSLAPGPTLSKAAAGGGKGGGGSTGDPAITKLTPSFAEPAMTLDVVISGSNFDEGSTAEWLLDGSPAAEHVATNRTTFVSSKELRANITVASTADLGLYDVAVTTSKGKKGVAVESFEILNRSDCGGKVSYSDSRVSAQWEAGHAIVGDQGNAPYRDGDPGLAGKIFYHDDNCSQSGDMILQWEGSPRRILIDFPPGHVSGLSGTTPTTLHVNFVAAMQIGSDVNGDGLTNGRDAKIDRKYPNTERSSEYPSLVAELPGYHRPVRPWQRLLLGLSQCRELQYDRIRITRTAGHFMPMDDVFGEWSLTPGAWTIESLPDASGQHLAQCYVTKANKLAASGTKMHVPFRVHMTEFRR